MDAIQVSLLKKKKQKKAGESISLPEGICLKLSHPLANAFANMLKAFLIKVITDKEVGMTGLDCLQNLLKNTFSPHD